MSRHIPLYSALLELLRALSVRTSLAHLLLPLDDDEEKASSAGVADLLDKMKQCVDTYAGRLQYDHSTLQFIYLIAMITLHFLPGATG